MSLKEWQRSFLCELYGGLTLLQRCFALCEWPTAENWRTAAAALIQRLYVRGAILGLRGYYHFLFGTTRQCKLFMLTNLCRRLHRLCRCIVPALVIAHIEVGDFHFCYVWAPPPRLIVVPPCAPQQKILWTLPVCLPLKRYLQYKFPVTLALLGEGRMGEKHIVSHLRFP